MIERIIDLSDAPVRLSVRHSQLLLSSGDTETSVPLEDVAVLMASHPMVTYTQAALSGLMEAGAAFIVCGANRMPSGMMLPLEGHHLQTERLEVQVQAGMPVRKRIWQQLVQGKLRNQAAVLRLLHGTDAGIGEMAKRVKSGDADNLEAQAARRYWGVLFGKAEFQRDRDVPGANAMLNYGYAIVRGVVGRAIVAAGMHPSIGVHHHNRYDPFCLADDVMEPFRAMVDLAVARYVATRGEMIFELNQEAKKALLTPLLGKYPVHGETRSLFDIAGMTAVSVFKTMQGTRKEVALPKGVEPATAESA